VNCRPASSPTLKSQTAAAIHNPKFPDPFAWSRAEATRSAILFSFPYLLPPVDAGILPHFEILHRKRGILPRFLVVPTLRPLRLGTPQCNQQSAIRRSAIAAVIQNPKSKIPRWPFSQPRVTPWGNRSTTARLPLRPNGPAVRPRPGGSDASGDYFILLKLCLETHSSQSSALRHRPSSRPCFKSQMSVLQSKIQNLKSKIPRPPLHMRVVNLQQSLAIHLFRNHGKPPAMN
jgi:hypothetical protein